MAHVSMVCLGPYTFYRQNPHHLCTAVISIPHTFLKKCELLPCEQIGPWSLLVQGPFLFFSFLSFFFFSEFRDSFFPLWNVVCLWKLFTACSTGKLCDLLIVLPIVLQAVYQGTCNYFTQMSFVLFPSFFPCLFLLLPFFPSPISLLLLLLSLLLSPHCLLFYFETKLSSGTKTLILGSTAAKS